MGYKLWQVDMATLKINEKEGIESKTERKVEREIGRKERLRMIAQRAPQLILVKYGPEP